ncbi:Rieske 2Fe-2S domain-containing protein [Prauserella flavalba]|uniref:Rieske 2Fe-2S domain-containing protein n=1 Tax=Prauserella flavalba TaxID=1477506 RepID=UPI0036E36EDC
MLSAEDNDLLTRIEHAPMGRMLREYWTPAVRSARLEPGGAPVRVRLFGEDFIAFRGTDGAVGFLAEVCPHRGASLALGRVEECEIRCIYHGWKFRADGQAVETPSEPPERAASLAARVRTTAAATYEAGGIVWVYLGERPQPPAFPGLPFVGLPDDHVRPLAAETSCNWLQAVEGTLDSSHVSILHQSWLDASKGNIAQAAADSSPRYEFDVQEYGVRFAAIRRVADGKAYVRVTEFVMPWTALIATGDEDCMAIIGTPIDDTRSRQWFIRWNSEHPLTEDTDTHAWYEPLTVAPDDFTELLRGKKMWGQDRKAMSAGHFSGIENLVLEDVAIQESQGPIVDRTKERLGASDLAVVRTRRLLLETLRAHTNGSSPRGADIGAALKASSGLAFTVNADVDWRAATEAEMGR